MKPYSNLIVLFFLDFVVILSSSFNLGVSRSDFFQALDTVTLESIIYAACRNNNCCVVMLASPGPSWSVAENSQPFFPTVNFFFFFMFCGNDFVEHCFDARGGAPASLLIKIFTSVSEQQ
uniref:Putative secreted protein n=1 Tax=Ixodes ricinus TaxID=34613 RepID=A0A147BF54_IXORI